MAITREKKCPFANGIVQYKIVNYVFETVLELLTQWLYILFGIRIIENEIYSLCCDHKQSNEHKKKSG